MKQVLQRSGLIEIVKLPEDARRRTTALHAGAANNNHIFFQEKNKNKRGNSVKKKTHQQQEAPRATLGLLPDKSTDVSVVWL